MKKNYLGNEKRWEERVRKIVSVDIPIKPISSNISKPQKNVNSYHVSDMSESYNLDSSKNSILSLMSVQSCSDDSSNTLHSDILDTYKKIDSLNERALNFNRLKKRLSSPKFNIFSKLSVKKPLRLGTESSNSLDHSLGINDGNDTFDESSFSLDESHTEVFSEDLMQRLKTGLTSTTSLTIDKHFSSSECVHNFLIHNIQNEKKKFAWEKFPGTHNIVEIATKSNTREIDVDDSNKFGLPIVRKDRSINFEEDLNRGSDELTSLTQEAKKTSNRESVVFEINNIKYLVRIDIRHKELAITRKTNNNVKVRKEFSKNKNIYRKVRLKKYDKNKKLIKEISHYENKRLLETLIKGKKQYVYNKKNKKCCSKFYFDHMISNISEKGKQNLFKEGHKFPFQFRFQNQSKYIRDFINVDINQRCKLRFHKKPNKLTNDNTSVIKKSIEKIYEPPVIFPKLNEETVKIGKGNILFPGCKIIAEKGKIYIAHNNLFEDNVMIINNTSENMYIGSFNIFRSGTHILNSMNIGDDNYFDYKSYIQNTTIGNKCFIGMNTRLYNMSHLQNKRKIIENYLGETNSYFSQENRKEIYLRFNHLL